MALMSFAEMLAEIPRLTAEERREVLRCIREGETDRQSALPGFTAERVNGRLVLRAPRVIRQEEVDEILEEFP